MKNNIVKVLASVICFVCIGLFMSGCSQNKRYDVLLQQADSIMNIDDDSAKVAIHMLDGVKSQLDNFSKSQKMHYQLLYHKAMNKAYIPFTSDSIMLEVVDYYKKKGTNNERMLAYYMLGCVYRDMQETPLALENYNLATEQADTLASDCDYGTLCRIYNQISILYSKQILPNEELNALNDAEKYAYKAKDTLNAIRYYANKSGVYNYINQKDSAAMINFHAANLFKKYGYNREAAIALGCNFDYYLLHKDYNKAKEVFKAYLSTGYKGNSNYEDAKAFLFSEKGKYYLLTHQLDSAYFCLQEGWAVSTDFGNKATLAKTFVDFYTLINKQVLANKYALLYSEYNDSSLIELRKSQLQQVQAMYNYTRTKDIAQRAKIKVAQRTKIIYLMLIGGAILFFIVYNFYKKTTNAKKSKIEMFQAKYTECQRKLENKQNELAKIKELNEENRAKLIHENECAIAELQKQLKNYELIFNKQDILNVERKLKDSSIYKKLVYIENHPSCSMSSNDWSVLEETMEDIIPGVIAIKRKTKPKEYHICLLIRLSFSPSTISNLTNCSLPDISNIRKRLLKKLCGKEGSAKDFDDFIRNLY